MATANYLCIYFLAGLVVYRILSPFLNLYDVGPLHLRVVQF